MTIPLDAPTVTTHIGNGAAATFDYEFKITDETDLAVYILGESFLTLGTDYTVAGVGETGGGSITLTAGALATGKTISIYDNVQPAQLTPYANQGAFYGYSHENSFDKLTRLVKRALRFGVDAIRLPEGTSWLIDRVTPAPEAGKYFRWNALANKIEFAGAPGVIVYPNTIGTVADMVADTSLEIGDVAHTLGYYAAGDGGDNAYQIVAAATGTADGGKYIDLDNGLQAYGLFPGNVINALQYGVATGGVVDNSDALDAMLDAYTDGITFELPEGEIGISRTFNIGDGTALQISTIHQGIKIHGQGTRVKTGWINNLALDPVGGTILKWVGAAGSTMVKVNGPIAVDIDGISLDGNNLAVRGLETFHMWSSQIKNINIRRYTSIGMWMQAYNNAQDPAQPVHPDFGNLVQTGSSANIIESITINSFGDSLAKDCLVVGNTYMEDPASSFNHDVNQCHFSNLSLLANGNSASSALTLRFTDSNLFSKCFVFAPGVSSGSPAIALRIVAPTTFAAYQKAFPSQIIFDGGQISSEAYSSDWLGGAGGGNGICFFGFAHGERAAASPRVPSHFGMSGFSDRGSYFGGNQLRIEDTSIAPTGSNNDKQQLCAPTVLGRNVATVQIANDASATSIYSYTLKPKVLAFETTVSSVVTPIYDRTVRVSVFGSVLNNTGGPQTLRMRLYFGATVCFEATATLAASAYYRPVIMECKLKSNLSPTTQQCEGELKIGDGSAGASTATPIGIDMVQVITGIAEDSTAANVLAVQATLGTASANMIFNANNFLVELL